MKSKLWKSIIILLSVVLALTMFAGCGQQAQEGTDAQEDKQQEEKAAEVATPAEPVQQNERRVIIDQNDREVELPAEINRVVTGRILPFPAVYFLARGSVEGLVGVHPSSKNAAEHSMLSVLAPGIMEAQTGFVEGGVLNLEELLRLRPDVYFYRGEQVDEEEIILGSGIPAIAVRTLTLADGNSLETLNSWLELLGTIFDVEERAEEIIRYGNEALGMITSRLWVVPEEDRPRALMLFRHGENEMKVSGSGFFGQWWLEATGAINVAEELKRIPSVDMEQIYKWNPEIIYISNFTTTMPEDLFNNTIDGQDWSQVDAVINGRVYKIPMGIYRWFPPSADTPLMLKWLAQKHHPEVFGDYCMEEEIREFYARFYGYNLSDEQIQMILNPVREGAIHR